MGSRARARGRHDGRPPARALGGQGAFRPYVDLVLRYSNQGDRVRPMADVMRRISAGEDAGYGTVPAPSAPRREPSQTHDLSDAQVAAIFACYRQGTGPRELAGRYGVTERAIKYLLKKHGVQRLRTGANGGVLLGSRP